MGKARTLRLLQLAFPLEWYSEGAVPPKVTFSGVRHKMMDKMQLPAGVRTLEWRGAKVYLMEDIRKVAM